MRIATGFATQSVIDQFDITRDLDENLMEKLKLK